MLDSAEKEDVGIYLKKYYPKGYNLLAKTLNTLEKSERSCYDGCIHKLVNEKNLSTIVRALENLAQVDPQVNSLVDKNLDTNNTFRIPTINGMPIGGYGIIGDRVKNAVKDINDFFKKSGEILKDRISGTSNDGFYQSAKSSTNTDSGFGQSVNDKFIRQSQNDIGDGGFVKTLPKANFDDNGFNDKIAWNDQTTQENSNIELEKTIKHEYGHTKQYENLGLKNYIEKVAIPSVNGYRQGLNGKQYYLQPWEHSADVLGGNGNVHVGDSDTSNIDPVGEVSDMKSLYTRLTQLFKELDSWYE